MITGKYREILEKAFDLLEFPAQDREEAVESLKKKFFYELLLTVKNRLSQTSQDFINNSQNADSRTDSPEVTAIREEIKKIFSEEELRKTSAEVFRRVLGDYFNFMTKELNLDQARSSQLKDLTDKV